jgi:hypothetical protein
MGSQKQETGQASITAFLILAAKIHEGTRRRSVGSWQKRKRGREEGENLGRTEKVKSYGLTFFSQF